jgi:hypothetical protein
MRLIDLAGQTFGELTVIERGASRGTAVTYWRCRCSCGTTVDVDAGALKRGLRTSCGHVPAALAEGRRPWPRDPRILVGADGTLVGPQGRLLTPWADAQGYLRVSIYRVDGVRRSYQPFVHVIVCETFHGPRPDGRQVAHGDGVRANCAAGNLSWKTPVENEADKLTHGTRPQGERVYCAKLTEQDVHAIRAARTAGATWGELAARYPVEETTIARAALRKTWRHI